MAATEVTDPQGVRWTVRRRWTPRWARVDAGRRFRSVRRRRPPKPTVGERRERERTKSRWYDHLDIPIPDELPVLGLILAAIAVLVLLWFVAIPLLLLLVDVLVVIVLLVLGAFAKVLFRRPWRVAADDGTGRHIERDVVGWRTSGAAVEQLRAEIEAGIAQPERNTGSSATT